MSYETLFNEQIRKANQQKQEIKPVVFKNSWVIIPYIVSGVINYTNKGFVDGEINPYDAETFKRIWTGNDSCCVIWEDSVKIVSGSSNPQLKYQLGNYKLGMMLSNSSTKEILKDSGYGEYTSEQIKNYLTFEFSADDNTFSAYDMLKFYKIPKFSKEDIYRIISIHKNFKPNTREIDFYTVSFESVNQTFSNSGKARQQNINMSSVGQGYLNPKVLSQKEFEAMPGSSHLIAGTDYKLLDNGEYLLADRDKVEHRPAKKAIIKLYGNAMPISMSFVGRPVFYGDSNTKLRALRPIFGCTLEQPITPNLQRTSNATNNWYFGEFIPSMDAWADISKRIKDNVNAVVATQNFKGTFAFNKSAVQNTNISADGPYLNNIYQEILGNNTGLKQWIPKIAQKNMTIPNVYGVDNRDNAFKYGGTTKNIIDILFDNYWVYKNDLQIPLNIKETTTFGSFIGAASGLGAAGAMTYKPKQNWLRIFGLIGIAAALLCIGIGFTVSRQVNPPPAKSVFGLVSAPFLDLSLLQFVDEISGPNPNRIPISSFSNNSVDPVNSAVFDTPNSFNFQVQMELTDLFQNNNPQNNLNPRGIWSTSSIGQTDKFSDQDDDVVTRSGAKMLMNGEQSLVPHKNIKGYIIEQINIDSCFQGDVSIEFLDINDQVIFSGIYQSQGKWTGNIRDRWTTINTSIFNNSNITTNQLMEYPKKIIEPQNSNWVPVRLDFDTSELITVSEFYLRSTTPKPDPNIANKGNPQSNIGFRTTQTLPTGQIKVLTHNQLTSWNRILANYQSIQFSISGDPTPGTNAVRGQIVINLEQFTRDNKGTGTYLYTWTNDGEWTINTTCIANNRWNYTYEYVSGSGPTGHGGWIPKFTTPADNNLSVLQSIRNVSIKIIFNPSTQSFYITQTYDYSNNSSQVIETYKSSWVRDGLNPTQNPEAPKIINMSLIPKR